MGENLEFTRNLREIYEKKTSEVDLGVVKDKGGGEQFLNKNVVHISAWTTGTVMYLI